MRSIPVGITFTPHDQPQVLFGIEPSIDEHLAVEIAPFSVARQFLRRNERDIVKVVPQAPEGALVLDPASISVFENVHLGVVRRLDERPVRMPQVDREIGLVEVTILGVPLTADPAHELLGRDRLTSRVFRCVPRPVGCGDRHSIVGRQRGIAFVQTDVDVVTTAVARAPLVPEDRSLGHLLTIGQEDVIQVRDDHVGSISHLDVDVVAEARRGGLHVYTCHSRDGREHFFVRDVARVQVDVVLRRDALVRVGAVSSLRAHEFLALGNRHLNDERIATLVTGTDVRGALKHVSDTPREDERDEDAEGENVLSIEGHDALLMMCLSDGLVTPMVNLPGRRARSCAPTRVGRRPSLSPSKKDS